MQSQHRGARIRCALFPAAHSPGRTRSPSASPTRRRGTGQGRAQRAQSGTREWGHGGGRREPISISAPLHHRCGREDPNTRFEFQDRPWVSLKRHPNIVFLVNPLVSLEIPSVEGQWVSGQGAPFRVNTQRNSPTLLLATRQPRRGTRGTREQRGAHPPAARSGAAPVRHLCELRPQCPLT